MTKKKTSKRAAQRAARARRKLINRILTIGTLVIAAGIIALFVFSSLKANQEKTRLPELVGTKQYSGPPPMMIDATKKYFATVKMVEGGEFVIQLYPDKAPMAVNNFVFLANEGYYDGVTFHRVLDGFMAQTGDPTGTGSGGPGYSFGNEINDLEYDKAGVVGMANTGAPNSNGSQFFIMFGPYPLSASDYTIFGQVIEGMEVVNGLTRRDPQAYPDYVGDMIETITITEE